jgi:transposase-like protein
MNDKDFLALKGQLAGLTDVQRQAIMEALASTAAGADAIALIEARFAATPCCGHCRSQSFGRWGHAGGLKRYRCKDCKRTFNALTGTPLAHLRRRDAWLAYAEAIVDRVSLRKAAKRAGIVLDTSFRWRHRFLEAAQDAKPASVAGVVEADETFILKSAKGSKKLVGRAPRKRGGTARKPGLSTDEHDAILIVRDRYGATSDAILPDLEGRTFAAVLEPMVAKDALLVSDGRAAYGQFAEAANILHIAINASKGEHVYGTYHIQNVNNYTSRFKAWMRPFNGVASKYLASYLGWHRMKDRDGERLTKQRCIYAAHGFAGIST